MTQDDFREAMNRAKRELKKETDLSHAEALEVVAKEDGYPNYKAALEALGRN